MLSSNLVVRLHLALHCLVQEAAFGHKPSLSEAVSDIVDIPLEELTEEQAERLVTDAINQRNKLFEEEATWQCQQG